MNRFRLRLRVFAAAVALASAAFGAASSSPALVPRPLTAMRADSAALLLSGSEGGPVRIALLALPGFRSDGSPRLFLYAEISGESLLRDAPPGSAGPLGVELSAYLVDASSRVVAHASEGLRLPPAEERAGLAAVGLRYLTAFDAPAGEYLVRFLARLRPTGGFGLRVASVRLAPAARPGAVVGPLLAVPLWPGPALPWLEARSPSLAADEPPRLPDGSLPAALPVLALGVRQPLFVALAAHTRPPATLPARLAPLAGGEERVVSLDISTPAAALGAGLDAYPATLDTEQAAAGIHALRLANEADPGGRGAVRIALLPPAADGSELPAWTAAIRPAPDRTPSPLLAAEAEPNAPSERRADRDQEVTRLRREIARSLAVVAGGDFESGIAALLSLEGATLDRDRRRALGWIEQAHQELRAALVARDPEVLLPLGLAYAELAEKAAMAHRTGLSHQAQESAAELARQYPQRSPGEGATSLAARTFLGLAGRFYELGATGRAQRLLAEADALDPGDGTAGRLVAFLDERQDERAKAADTLRALLKRHPGDREARLRLALCELALGEGAGLRRLRELAAEPGGDWIAAVTYQELVRRELADQQFDAAMLLAREGLRRVPADPGLRTQLSWLLQQSGRPAESLSTLAPLAAARGAEPPRRRYSGWPREALRSARRDAEQAAQLRLPALRAALAAVDPAPAKGGPR